MHVEECLVCAPFCRFGRHGAVMAMDDAVHSSSATDDEKKGSDGVTKEGNDMHKNVGVEHSFELLATDLTHLTLHGCATTVRVEALE